MLEALPVRRLLGDSDQRAQAARAVRAAESVDCDEALIPPAAALVLVADGVIPPTDGVLPPAAALDQEAAALVPLEAALLPPAAALDQAAAALAPLKASLVPLAAALLPPAAALVLLAEARNHEEAALLPPAAALLPPAAALVLLAEARNHEEAALLPPPAALDQAAAALVPLAEARHQKEAARDPLEHALRPRRDALDPMAATADPCSVGFVLSSRGGERHPEAVATLDENAPSVPHASAFSKELCCMSDHGHPPKTARLSDAEQRERLAGLMLISRALTPDEAALLDQVFPALVRPLYEPVKRFLRRSLSEADAFDVAQDAFVKLRDKLREEGFKENPARLVIKLAFGALLNHRRGKRREPLTLGLPPSSDEPPRTPPGLSGKVDAFTIAQRILPQLSDAHRDVLELVLLADLQHEEAAAVLELPLATLRSRLVVAKRCFLELARKEFPDRFPESA